MIKPSRLLWLVIVVFFLVMKPPATSLTASPPDEAVCQQIVFQALELSSQLCEDTGRNQACYGHVQVEAQPQPGISDLLFQEAGDIVDVVNLQSLRLSPMDLEEEAWGVALMRLQANLSEDEPRQ
ncbi:MAG: hypothetical protein GX573_03175, partial [Chloroflexi bacterium]|nr:hypothetical protein [Chloroflexota bacterium]